MSKYQFSEQTYAKMIFHAAKYPHLAVNGVLLAVKNDSDSKAYNIVDAIPLFHQCLTLTPMAEIALIQIDTFAESKNLVIAGYYVASENFEDNSIDKVPAAQIAEKIFDNNKKACFVIIDNQRMSLNQPQAAIKVHSGQRNDNAMGNGGVRWSKADFNVDKLTLEGVSTLLKLGAMKDIVDFDEHLDNPVKDWTNDFFNHDIQKIMAMY